ncbi:MAG TPA: aminoacyl-tRNA hydrolase [Acidimicrobiia bacterium]|nr:aminoacyl-tRNA hydrolase [Acidimicrobiia bacterium]
MKAIVGLRNPGADYEATRHNVGFEVVDRVVVAAGERWKRAPSRLRVEIADLRIAGEKVVAAAPLTYMNESGQAVRSLCDYFGVGEGEMLVVHDDIDLPFGRLRLQVGGGTGGHNGLRSIERALGHREFARVKVGVGRPPGRMDPADFVLRRFTRAERQEVELMLEDAAEVVETWVTDPDAAIRLAAERRAS